MLETLGGQDQLTKGAQVESAAPAPPCAMVIFGAAGDLTKRLVVPALYNLTTARQLSNSFQLVGVDRAPKSTQEWCAGLTETMKEFVAQDGEFHVDNIDQTAWRWLTERMSYLQGDLNDPTTYRRLREHLANVDKTAGTAGNHLFNRREGNRLRGHVHQLSDHRTHDDDANLDLATVQCPSHAGVVPRVGRAF